MQEYLNKIDEASETHVTRRSKLQTYCDLLQVISNRPSKPTHIMYQSNLSWKVLHEHLDLLYQQGLIQLPGELGRSQYSLTQKGMALLNRYLTIEQDLNIA